MNGDQHGNLVAQEGCTRCVCGAKYWERDVCVSCGSPVLKVLPYVTGDGERFAHVDDALDHVNAVARRTGRFIGLERAL